MPELENLIQNNRRWAEEINERHPDFFQKLSSQQTPEYLWIGCADSRVPANEIVGLLPGEMFVHRNVANVVVHSDLNCLSVLQYAVEVLRVKHILVVGHYGCGGVKAALNKLRLGLIDNWLRHVQDVAQKHHGLLEQCSDVHQRSDRLCELNVIEQVVNVCETTIVQDAWARGHDLTVHGWVYGLQDGHVQSLQMGVSRLDDLEAAYQRALQGLPNR